MLTLKSIKHYYHRHRKIIQIKRHLLKINKTTVTFHNNNMLSLTMIMCLTVSGLSLLSYITVLALFVSNPDISPNTLPVTTNTQLTNSHITDASWLSPLHGKSSTTTLSKPLGFKYSLKLLKRTSCSRSSHDKFSNTLTKVYFLTTTWQLWN